MLQNWLTKRLTPVKRGTQRWKEFAESIEEFWAEYFDPHFSRAENLRSIYTAHADDQEMILVEMGDYYEDDMPADNRPILVAQRKLELMQKERDVPLKAVLRRIGVTGHWEPLYCRDSETYGNEFFTEVALRNLGYNPDSCLLTSHGMLILDFDSGGYREDIADLAIRRSRSILPLHIVMSSMQLSLAKKTTYIAAIVSTLSTVTTTILPCNFSAGSVYRSIGMCIGETVIVMPRTPLGPANLSTGSIYWRGAGLSIGETVIVMPRAT